MSYTITNHPSEEVLTDCVLDKIDAEVEHHLEECSECKEFVDDLRTISNDIAALEDKEVPQHVFEKIMAISHQKKRSKILTFVQSWYKNSFFYGILTVLFVIIMYAIFTMLL